MVMLKMLLLSCSLLSAIPVPAQTPGIIRLKDLQEIISEKTHPVHIINFWATWCGPCVKELPYFEKINAENRPGVRVTLVSLDLDLDPDPGKVYRFVDIKNIQSEVLLLNEPDPDSWIDKIDREWSGALPATLLINHHTGKRKFVGKALQEGELEKHLEDLK